jgi:hypothetical protein
MKRIHQFLKNNPVRLFFTSILQVTLVASNVIFISRGMVLPMLLTGFCISYVWAANVKKVTSGTNREKFSYALGASIGTYIGYMTATYLKLLY